MLIFSDIFVANLSNLSKFSLIFFRFVKSAPKHFLDNPTLLVYVLLKTCTKDILINGSDGG